MKLSELQNREAGIIVKILGRGAFRKRITEMGFVKGKKITVVKNAPLKDPIEYSILDYEISLRRSEAALIEVVPVDESHFVELNNFNGVLIEEDLKKTISEKSKVINIAFVGNPNAGKTTLFNQTSNSQEHVGNYSGVTVDSKTAHFQYNSYSFNVTDLPGTYSLSAYSPEELYVRRHIFEQVPDIVVNVIDASNLERNLYLTTQLIDMDIKVVVALNMYDELHKKGSRFYFKELGSMLGIPFVPTVGSKGKGIDKLLDKIIEVYNDNEPNIRHIHINYGKGMERGIQALQTDLNKDGNYWLLNKIAPRFIAIKLLEKDQDICDLIKKCPNFEDIKRTANYWTEKLEKNWHDDSETFISDSRYGFIAGALKETYIESPIKRRRKTEAIDNFITHKIWGFPIFIFFMWLMFQSTYTFGEYPMNWIDKLVGFLSESIATYMPAGMLKDLIVDGVIGGVGGVIVFLPNILILFFFISLMEDTGYMSRAAFIMDKIMHKIGLHGKSFIPLIMGFGCNVPAIMATRTLENRNDRLLTMLINPFMSCSARLPVYVLIIGAVFPENPGTILFSLYILGIFVAALVAILFKKTIFKSQEAPFVMELPPYRMPTLQTTLRHMWNKGVQYLQKMGGIILVASILIWALGYFPRQSEFSVQFDKKIEQNQTFYLQKIAQLDKKDTLLLKNLKHEMHNIENVLLIEKENKRQENSYIGKLGKSVAPVLAPLGFDWKMGVSIITGIAAKEIVVSTMGVLYHADLEADENSQTLIHKIREERYSEGKKKGEKVFTPLVSISFLVFILLYFPCIAVIAVINKESGSWKWAIFTMVYTTGLAWILSFSIYQIGSFFIS
jgi:ferrous iron transport protein B